MVRRFTREVTPTTAGVDPNAGDPGQVLAAELERFSARRNQELDQAAAEAGFQEGQELGAGGEAIPGQSMTIRGRARRRGAILAHQAAVQTDIRDQVGQFAIEHPNDPEAFDARVAGLSEGLLSEAPPELEPFIQQRIADYAGRAKLQVIDQQQRELEAEAAADLSRGVEGFLDDAKTAAFEGDVALIEARRQELEALLEEGVEGELLDEGAAANLQQDFEREVVGQEVLGNFDRLIRTEGVEAGADAIARWQDVEASNIGITAEDKEAVTRQMITLRNRQRSLLADRAATDSAALAAEQRARTGRVKDAISVLRNGFAPDNRQAQQVADDLQWLQDPELAADFDAAQAIQGEVHRFRRLPTSQRDAELIELEQALRAGGASADQVQLLEALQDTSAEVDRAMQTDPRGFVNREGLIDDEPLDFSGAAELTESITARQGATDIGRQLTGEPLPLFTAAEADQLAAVYDQAEIEERVGLLGIMTAGAGDDALATLGQLDQNGQTRMALLGNMVMAGQGTLARDVMRGQAVLAADKGITPKRIDYQPVVDDVIGAALGDWPNQRQAYIDAAFAKYAELKSATGDLSDLFEPGLFEQALEQVLPTAKFNGRRVAVPPGVSEDAFEAWSDSWRPEDFAGVANGTPERLLVLARERGRLVELGAGRYGVSLVSAENGRDRPLVRDNGEPFVLEYPGAR